MALYRAFSVGRFSCSRLSPRVSVVTQFPSDGYSLVVRKDSAKACCLGCVKYFGLNQGLRVTENEHYLTISSP